MNLIKDRVKANLRYNVMEGDAHEKLVFENQLHELIAYVSELEQDRKLVRALERDKGLVVFYDGPTTDICGYSFNKSTMDNRI